MKKFLQNQFWFSISTHLRLSISDSQIQLKDIINRLENGKTTKKRLSPEVMRCVEYYFENKLFLDLVL